MRAIQTNHEFSLNLRVGELVKVRSAQEILATLDENGELESLPFMPEMLQYCGQQLIVHKVAHKVCDTISWTGMHRMRNAVHLSAARCDGLAHGGCQAGCLLYWKEAWLERVVPLEQDVASSYGHLPFTAQMPAAPHCTLPLLHAATRRPAGADGEDVFSCQATEILRAAPQCMPLRDVGQYLQDVRSGNAGVSATLRGIGIGVFNRAQAYSRRYLPRRLQFRNGLRWGFLEGTRTKTPTGRTGLQPGDRVRVKSKEEILQTVNKGLLNRGLSFDVEMVKYCGREFRVLRRVDRIVDEKTGKMIDLQGKEPCIVLEGVVCEGEFNVNCPRSIYSFWREIWLEKID